MGVRDEVLRANATAALLLISCGATLGWLSQAMLGDDATLTTRNGDVLALVAQVQLLMGAVVFATAPCAAAPTPTPATIIASAVSGVVYLVIGTVLVYFGAVMLGAPLWSKMGESLVFSFCISALAAFPGGCVARLDWEKARQLYLDFESTTPLELLLLIVFMSPLAGAWVGAFAVPLDWDRPWQPWPISSSYGALAGYCAGLVLAIAANTARWLMGSRGKAKES